jgi:putative addiction module killer protein
MAFVISSDARIQARIGRLASGNPGLYRVPSDGVCELKIDTGPGYRVYACGDDAC